MHLPSIMRNLLCLGSCPSPQQNSVTVPVETLFINPWTMDGFGKVEIPASIEITELLRVLHYDNPIYLENILLEEQYTDEQKKSLVVRVQRGIETGISRSLARGFDRVVRYLGRLNNPSELTSFILSYAGSIKTGMCKWRIDDILGMIIFNHQGYTKAIATLPNSQDKYRLTQKVFRCIKKQILYRYYYSIEIFLLHIGDAVLRNQFIFDLLGSIPDRYHHTDRDFISLFGHYFLVPGYSKEQIFKTKFVFELSRITNLDIALGAGFSRLEYVLGMLGPQDEKIKFILGLKKGMLQIAYYSSFQDIRLAMRTANILLPGHNEVQSAMDNVDLRSFGTKGIGEWSYRDGVKNLLKFFLAIEDNVKVALSAGNAAGLAIILGYMPIHPKTKLLARYQDTIKEAVYTRDAAGLALILSYLSGDLKAILLERYVDDVRAAASTGDLNPLRTTLENIDGHILLDTYIQHFKNLEIGVVNYYPGKYGETLDFLRSLEKKLEKARSSLDESETGSSETKAIKKKHYRTFAAPETIMDVKVKSHGPLAFRIFRANLYNCQARLSNLIKMIDSRPVHVLVIG